MIAYTQGKKTEIFGVLCSPYDSKSTWVSSQLRALVGFQWGRGAWAGMWYLCALVPLPARASTAIGAQRGCMAFPNLPPEDGESFGWQKIAFLCLCQNFRNAHLKSSWVQTFPVQQLLCCLANPQAHSIVKCLQSESLKAVFQSLSPSILCPKRRRLFITSDIFSEKLTKGVFIFFLTMPCYLCLF